MAQKEIQIFVRFRNGPLQDFPVASSASIIWKLKTSIQFTYSSISLMPGHFDCKMGPGGSLTNDYLLINYPPVVTMSPAYKE